MSFSTRLCYVNQSTGTWHCAVVLIGTERSWHRSLLALQDSVASRGHPLHFFYLHRRLELCFHRLSRKKKRVCHILSQRRNSLRVKQRLQRVVRYAAGGRGGGGDITSRLTRLGGSLNDDVCIREYFKKCGLLDPRRAILYFFSFYVPSQYSFRQKSIAAFARHVSFCQRRKVYRPTQ